MSGRGGSSATPPTVIVGVDGSGRTHRLDQIAASVTVSVVRITAPPPPLAELTSALNEAAGNGFTVLVDDAHALPIETLRLITDAGRRGANLVIARRPSIDSPALADLDGVAAARGRVERLQPLGAHEMAELARRRTGELLAPDAAASLVAHSAGLPAVAATLIAASPGEIPADLVARVHRRITALDPDVARLLRVLALGLELDDTVLAAAAGSTPPQLMAAMRELRDSGLLAADGERVVPAVAASVLADLTPTERRGLHDLVGSAMLSAATDPVVSAVQLRTARARSALAAQAYQSAGERLRFSDPAAALGWFDDAVEAGADPRGVAIARAEAATTLGVAIDPDAVPTPDPADAARLQLVVGAMAAHQGRADRSAQALLDAGALGPCLAVPALVATGRLDEARRAATGPAAAPIRLLAQAVINSAQTAVALPLFIEAAEALETAPPPLVLPDTPHALGALIAVAAGDPTTAQQLLERALDRGCGGPRATERHRLLLAWVRLRTGRYDTAVAELRRLGSTDLSGRDRLVAAALAAGLARRCGDITALGEAWNAVEPVLARRAVDLFQIELVEELAVAAARLRRHQRIEPALQLIEEAVAHLAPGSDWAVAAGWVRLQIAVVGEDAPAAAAAARRLEEVAAAGPRQRAQCAAAGVWADALAGTVNAATVLAAAAALAHAGLPWEASRLAGQAAIRSTDPAAARRLLECARDLSGHEPTASTSSVPDPGEAGDSRLTGLSEREVEVARLVLAGHTHREIGSRLYIAPKTVEHHVARIRGKFGATSRAEFMAALREAFREEEPSGI